MGSEVSQRFEFEGYRLDRSRRELIGPDGNSLPLPAKAFETLVYFLEHPGEVIERHRLIDAVWPNTVVEENNLSQAIAAIRRVLGDGFIVTVARQGYQFVAEVSKLGPKTPPAPTKDDAAIVVSPQHEADPGRSLRRLVGYAALSALGLLAMLVAFYPAETDRLSRPKVAVLPCTNLSPNPDDSYFTAGIHEELVDRLAGLNELLVVPGASVLPYVDTNAPITEIADELGATAVVDCSVRYAGRRVRVTAQLIDPSSNVQLWNDAYEEDVSDLNRVFAIETDIATSIARALDAELTPAESQQLAQMPTESPEAYSLYLQARESGFEESWRSESYFSLLDRAIEADPEFALVFALRARGRLERIRISRVLSESPWNAEHELELARQDARRAIELDPRLALAHVVSAGVAGNSGNSAESRSHMEQALELAPNDIDILTAIAGYYIRDYRHSEARELLQRAKRLDPTLLYLDEYFYYMAGDLDTAAERSARRVEVTPGSARAHLRLGNYEALRGNAAVAEVHLRLAEELYVEDPDPVEILSILVYAYGRIGLREDALRVFRRIEVAVERRGQPLAPPAGTNVYLGIGDEERAYEWATIMADEPLPPYVSPQLEFTQNTFREPIFDEARFLVLRRKLGFPD